MLDISNDLGLDEGSCRRYSYRLTYCGPMTEEDRRLFSKMLDNCQDHASAINAKGLNQSSQFRYFNRFFV